MIETRFLEPDEFHLINEYFDRDGVPRPDPQWSRVIAAVDTDKDLVVGIVCLQLVAHLEPIIVHPDYRGQGIARELAQMIDGYVTGTGLPGAYCQPINDKSKAVARSIGFIPLEHEFYLKLYTPEFRALSLGGLPENAPEEEGALWPLPSPLLDSGPPSLGE